MGGREGRGGKGRKEKRGMGKRRKGGKRIRRHKREEGNLQSVVFASSDSARNLQAAKADGCPWSLQPLPSRVVDTGDGWNDPVPDDLCEECVL